MRIVHAIPYFPPAKRFGGVPEAVYSLVQAQSKLGHEIIVLTTGAGLDQDISRNGLILEWKHTDTLRAVGKCNGITILYIPNRRPQWANKYKVFTADFCNTEVATWLSSSIDILHVHEVHIPGYRKLVQHCMDQGASLCLSCHGSLTPPVHHGIRKWIHRLWDPYMRKGWFHKAEKYFALSSHELNQLIHKNIHPQAIQILPHGAPCFPPPYQKLSFPVSEKREHPTFLYLGRIHPAKGVLIAVKAFCRIMKNGYKVRFVCCGPDEGGVNSIQNLCDSYNIPVTRDAILSQAGVYVLPEINRSCLPTLFQYMDYTICPSPYEAFGLVPVESLLCNVPIIITSAYGCLEHIQSEKENITVVPPNNKKALIQAMQDCLVLEPSSHKTFPNHSLLPSWNRIAQIMCSHYQEIIQKKAEKVIP